MTDSIAANQAKQPDFDFQNPGKDFEDPGPYLPEIHGPASSASYSGDNKASFQVASNRGERGSYLQAGADSEAVGAYLQLAASDNKVVNVGEKKDLKDVRDNDLMNAVGKEEIRPYLKELGLPLEGPELDKFLSNVHRGEIIKHLNNQGANLTSDISDQDLATAQRDQLVAGLKELDIFDQGTLDQTKSSDPKVREAGWNEIGKSFAKIMQFSGDPSELYNFANPVESLKNSTSRYLEDMHQFIRQQEEGYGRR